MAAEVCSHSGDNRISPLIKICHSSGTSLRVTERLDTLPQSGVCEDERSRALESPPKRASAPNIGREELPEAPALGKKQATGHRENEYNVVDLQPGEFLQGRAGEE